MTKNKVSPEISKYFSELSKRRKNPYHGFADKSLAKTAGNKGRETQREKRQAVKGTNPVTGEDEFKEQR